MFEELAHDRPKFCSRKKSIEENSNGTMWIMEMCLIEEKI